MSFLDSMRVFLTTHNITQTNPLPRYTHPLLTRILKNTPYTTLIRAYPHNMEMLKDVAEKEKAIFATVRPSSFFHPPHPQRSAKQDKNLGLINLALSRAPRWALKKLTGTYVTLGLADIARLLGIEGGEEEIRDLILSMVGGPFLVTLDGWLTDDPRLNRAKSRRLFLHRAQ